MDEASARVFTSMIPEKQQYQIKCYRVSETELYVVGRYEKEENEKIVEKGLFVIGVDLETGMVGKGASFK